MHVPNTGTGCTVSTYRFDRTGAIRKSLSKKLKRYGDEALTWQTLRSWAGSFRAAFALSAKRERIVEKRCVPSIERSLSKLLMRHHFVSSARCNSPCSHGGTIAVDAGTRSATNTQLGV